MSSSRDNPSLGGAFAVASAFVFAGVAAAIKHVSAEVPTEMIVFFRSALALVPLLPFLFRVGLRSLGTNCVPLHLARAFAGLSAMYCYFYAIHHLHLAEAVVLAYSAPLFIPFTARLWLGEPLSTRIFWAAGFGFTGILLIVKPGPGIIAPAAVVGLLSGVFTAVAFVGIRRLSETEPMTRTVFYFWLISTAVSAIPLLWAWQMPPPQLWGLLVLIGVLAGVGQMLLTRAYALAAAARIGPFSYSTVLFAALLGWFVWGEVLDGISFAGAALVSAAGVIASRLSSPGAHPSPEGTRGGAPVRGGGRAWVRRRG